MKVVGCIFARRNSKGVAKKNIRELGGKPLVAWAIEQARAVRRIERVVVSTDCEEIAQVAQEYGAQVPFLRPAALAGDNTPEWAAWRHALEFFRDVEGEMPDVMVSVPPTSPFRSARDLELCLDNYELGDADIVVTMTESNRNPYFNMLTRAQDGSVSLVVPPDKVLHRRQDAPKVFDMTTVAYVVNTDFVMRASGIFEGKARGVFISPERSLDIDTELDFQIADILMQRQIDRTKV